MPIKVFECAGCAKRFELILRAKETGKGEKCPACGSEELIPVLSSFSNYRIKGDNSASTRPKGK